MKRKMKEKTQPYDGEQYKNILFFQKKNHQYF